MEFESEFEIYTRILGRVRSGAVLANTDYGTKGLNGFTPYGEREKLAVTMAAQDVKLNKPLRSRSEFEDELDRLQS